jgi:hypothetical protein
MFRVLPLGGEWKLKNKTSPASKSGWYKRREKSLKFKRKHFSEMSDGIFYYPKYLLDGKFIYISRMTWSRAQEIFMKSRPCFAELKLEKERKIVCFEDNVRDLTALTINIYYLDIKCFGKGEKDTLVKGVEVEATICHWNEVGRCGGVGLLRSWSLKGWKEGEGLSFLATSCLAKCFDLLLLVYRN